MLALLLALTARGELLTPRDVDWSTAQACAFPGAWLPPAPLWRAEDDARALPNLLREWLAERPPPVAGAAWMASFGDCVLEQRRRGGTPAALEAQLLELQAALPDVHARWGPLLCETMCADALRRDKWDAAKERTDDGIYFGALLKRRAFAIEPWKAQRGASTIHQAAALVHADLDALLEALHDYAAAFRDPGAQYRKLDPEPASIVRGVGGEIGPFAALRLSIRSDLPFPFSHYDCTLGVLHTLGGDGVLATHIYGAGEDFYWFAGSDLCLPVETASGAWVGTLIARVSGFDLRGVPDADDDRKAGTRAALGHLKRRAELAYEKRAASGPRTIRGAIPEFRVRTR
jgi:hypothetical protein